MFLFRSRLHNPFSTIVQLFACFYSLSLLPSKANPKYTLPVLVTRPCGFVRLPKNYFLRQSLQNFQTIIQAKPVRYQYIHNLRFTYQGIRCMERHLQSTHSRLATANYNAKHRRYWNSLLALCYRKIHLFGSRPDAMEPDVPLHAFSFSSKVGSRPEGDPTPSVYICSQSRYR